jgi:hypothetical protein
VGDGVSDICEGKCTSGTNFNKKPTYVHELVSTVPTSYQDPSVETTFSKTTSTNILQSGRPFATRLEMISRFTYTQSTFMKDWPQDMRIKRENVTKSD